MPSSQSWRAAEEKSMYDGEQGVCILGWCTGESFIDSSFAPGSTDRIHGPLQSSTIAPERSRDSSSQVEYRVCLCVCVVLLGCESGVGYRWMDG
jgi:hypothetical protein